VKLLCWGCKVLGPVGLEEPKREKWGLKFCFCWEFGKRKRGFVCSFERERERERNENVP